MKRQLNSIFLAIALLAISAMASAQTQPAELVLYDFEGDDTGNVAGAQPSKVMARTGKASLLWENHTKYPSASFAARWRSHGASATASSSTSSELSSGARNPYEPDTMSVEQKIQVAEQFAENVIAKL